LLKFSRTHTLAGCALRLLYALSGLVFAEGTASAQIFEISRSSEFVLESIFGDIAHDPVHDVYFVVSGVPVPTQRLIDRVVVGRFIDRAGNALSAQIVLDSQHGFVVSQVAYSADVSDGAGGFGGFMVIWTNIASRSVVAQIVSYPGRLVGPKVPIFTAPPGLTGIMKADIAYSPTDRVFLVVLGFLKIITPSGSALNGPSTLVRLNLDAQPIGETALSSDPNLNCPSREFSLECNEVSVVWNPTSGEFAAVYNEVSEKTLARVRGDGTVISRTALGIGPRFGALAVNASTGNYLILGAGLGTTGAELDVAGNLVSRGFVTSLLVTDNSEFGFMGLSYLPASATFLLVGQLSGPGEDEVLLELNQHGVALPTTLTRVFVGSVLASHPVAPEWMHVRLTWGGTAIIGTATRFGSSDARLGGCTKPDPFVTVGGGTCLNGGWVPRLRIASATLPPGGCTTPDPFAVLGGGSCINGGWLPPGMVAPIPPPPPQGCVSQMPAADWVCVHGGWVPPTHPLAHPAPSPAPSPAPCATPDPFTTIGGGICVNGGWVPRGLPLGVNDGP
jgi:hypothetical protein